MPAIRFSLAFAAAAAFLLSAATLQAQPLAERVPEDAFAYVGWRGTLDMGEAYEGSHLAGVLEASQYERIFDEMLPALTRRIGEEDAEAREALSVISAIATAAWRHPSAFFVTEFTADDRAEPVVRLGFLVQAGDDGPALMDKLQAILQQIEGAPVRVLTERRGDLVLALVGYEDAVELPNGDASLARVERLQGVMAKLGGDPVFAGYLDVDALRGRIDDINMRVAGGQEQMAWAAIKEVGGLEGMRAIAFASGFDGRMWSEAFHIAAPAPRQGMLAMLDGEPIDDAALDVIPRTAMIAAAGRFDLDRLYGELRGAAARVMPGVEEEIDRAVTQANNRLGFNIREDLLQALGDQWSIYNDADVAGTGMLGLVVVGTTRDADRLDASLDRLNDFLNATFDQLLAGAGGAVSIAARTTTYDDLEIRYLALPGVTPAWALHEDRFILALYPQAVVGAADFIDSDRPSIIANEAFAALRERLGGAGANGVQFMDLPQGADSGYANTLLVSRLYMGLADLFGVPSPAIVVPPLSRIRPHLLPLAYVTVADGEGWTMRGLTPFPGAQNLGTQSDLFAIQQASFLAGTMLPALGAARRSARDAQSMSQLRQLAMALHVYHADHGEAPPDLATLVTADMIRPEMLRHPDDQHAAPAPVGDKDALHEWIDRHGGYIYVPGVDLEAGFDRIVIFERPRQNPDGTTAAAFADGHAERMPVFMLDERLEAQTGRGLDAWTNAGHAHGTTAIPTAPR